MTVEFENRLKKQCEKARIDYPPVVEEYQVEMKHLDGSIYWFYSTDVREVRQLVDSMLYHVNDISSFRVHSIFRQGS